MRFAAVVLSVLLLAACAAPNGAQQDQASETAALEAQPMTLFLCLDRPECQTMLIEARARAAERQAPLVVFALPMDGASRDFALRLAQLYAIEPVAAEEVLEALATSPLALGAAGALDLATEGATGVSTLGPPPQDSFEPLLAAVLEIYHRLGGTNGPLLVEGDLSKALTLETMEGQGS